MKMNLLIFIHEKLHRLIFLHEKIHLLTFEMKTCVFSPLLFSYLFINILHKYLQLFYI